jgi:hypothetical protein
MATDFAVTSKIVSGLLNSFAFFADNVLVRIPNPFTFVRLGRIETTNLGGDQPNQMLTGPLYGEFRVLLDGDFDLVRDGIRDRMGVPQAKIQILTLHGRLETDPLDLEPFGKSIRNTFNQVIEYGPTESMKGLRLRVVAFPANQE